MDLGTTGKVLGFSDPANVSNTALFSYHPLIHLYFLLVFFFIPYPLYRFAAHRFGWELYSKSWARHWTDGMLCCSYGLILFVFGNYSHCLSWITVATFYPSLFGYGLIAELPFTKTSLPNIRNWSLGMWTVFLMALILILGFAGFHIYLASTLTHPFVFYYVCGLLIPLNILMVAKILISQVNSNNGSDQDSHSGSTSKSSHLETTLESAPLALESSQQHNHLSLHLHHWQIFYALAFFTRFTHPVSQAAAGIVLASYMEGVCAYGYDHLVNDS
ncbi:hypothetical protein BC941DRAFT_438697 [Chlamydoabsidia padenii]|nr:hypothetical protein BC941DRAFT_438697 [Chlamydoabsidia padenii]